MSRLRGLLVSRSELAEGPASRRASLASGLEDLALRADILASAAQRGAAVTTRVGIALCLALAVAAARYSMGRRRREMQLSAGLGRHPASAGLLYAAELVPIALVAAVAGWFLARALVSIVVGSTSPTRAVLTSAGVWSAGTVAVAVVASGAVVAVATRVETRRLEGRREVNPPWLTVLVTGALAATVGLVTRAPAAGDPLGPLDLLVPPLLVAAIAALGRPAGFRRATPPRPGPPAAHPPHRRHLAGPTAPAGPRPGAGGGHDDRRHRPGDARLLWRRSRHCTTPSRTGPRSRWVPTRCTASVPPGASIAESRNRRPCRRTARPCGLSKCRRRATPCCRTGRLSRGVLPPPWLPAS